MSASATQSQSQPSASTHPPPPQEKTPPQLTQPPAFFYQTVDLSTLPTPQLTAVKQQLTQELQHLTTSFAQLKSAQGKFRECGRCVGEVMGGDEGGKGGGEGTLCFFSSFLAYLALGGRLLFLLWVEVEGELWVKIGAKPKGKWEAGKRKNKTQTQESEESKRRAAAEANGTSLPGTPILVPLTPSLYVPGTLASTETVLVDVGTGFYVEKVRTTHSSLLVPSFLASIYPAKYTYIYTYKGR